MGATTCHRHPAAVALALAVLVAWFLPACGTTPERPIRPEFDLRSPDVNRRTKAVALVAAQRDARHVPTLIFLLDDEDGAVRESANSALKKITGYDAGYRAYAPAADRRRWQEDWRTWWRSEGRNAPGPTGGGGGPSGYTGEASHDHP